MKDIDCLFDSSRNSDDEHNTVRSSTSTLTFAGLLNAIDGVAAQEGRLLIITTNHPERLAPALVRPGVPCGIFKFLASFHMCTKFANSGRIDRKIEFPLCTKSQVQTFVEQFYEDKAVGSDFANAAPEAKMSMAHLQGILMQHRDDPKGALQQLREEFS